MHSRIFPHVTYTFLQSRCWSELASCFVSEFEEGPELRIVKGPYNGWYLILPIQRRLFTVVNRFKCEKFPDVWSDSNLLSRKRRASQINIKIVHFEIYLAYLFIVMIITAWSIQRINLFTILLRKYGWSVKRVRNDREIKISSICNNKKFVSKHYEIFTCALFVISHQFDHETLYKSDKSR